MIDRCHKSGEVELTPPEYRCFHSSNGGSIRVEVTSPHVVRLEVRRAGQRIASTQPRCGLDGATYHSCDYELPAAGVYDVVILNDDPAVSTPFTVDLSVH